MIAGLHCAHILFYNRVLDELSEFDVSRLPAGPAGELSDRYVAFLIARQVTLWPFGHSMVRPSYRANFTSGTRDSASATADPFFGLVFDANQSPFNGPINTDREDLLGGYPAPRRYIGWQTFFDFGDGQVKNNKKVDPVISSVLFTLPLPAIAPHTQTAPTVLPQRNLLRQLTWGLPSGQTAVATTSSLQLGRMSSGSWDKRSHGMVFATAPDGECRSPVQICPRSVRDSAELRARGVSADWQSVRSLTASSSR